MSCPSMAAELAFGLPTVFQTTEKWQTVVKGQTFDVGECAQRIHTGVAATLFVCRTGPFVEVGLPALEAIWNAS
jgi:hypothetical protein